MLSHTHLTSPKGRGTAADGTDLLVGLAFLGAPSCRATLRAFPGSAFRGRTSSFGSALNSFARAAGGLLCGPLDALRRILGSFCRAPARFGCGPGRVARCLARGAANSLRSVADSAPCL